MNWGGFAGGFAQGFSNGVTMGKTIDTALKQKKIDDVRAQGLAEAQAVRAAEVDSKVQESGGSAPAASVGVTGQPAAASVTIKPEDEDRPLTRRRVLSEPATAPAAQQDAAIAGQATPATPATAGLQYTFGGKTYATRDEARAAADKATPDVMHFMSKTLVPRMQQAYFEQGNVEMADAWGKWAEDRDNKAAMKDWAGAFRAAQLGDFEKAADHVFDLYKRYDDGITPLSKETVKDNRGNVTGFNVRLKRDATGEEYSQFIDKRSLTEMGLSALSPQAMFETQFKRQQAADEAAAKNAAEIAKEQRALQADNYKAARDNIYTKGLRQLDNQFQSQRDYRQQQDRIELKTIESQLESANASSKVRREVGAKVDALRVAGYSDEFINGVLPSLLGVGEYKKAMSPEDAKLKIRGELMANDREFQKMTEPERAAEVGRVMEFVYGKPGNAAAPRSTAPTGPSYPPVWRQ